MKRILMVVAFLAVLVLASGCTNPFVKNKETQVPTVAGGHKSFVFEIARPVREELREKFLETVSRRLNFYSYEMIQVQFIESNKIALEFDVPKNVIFLEDDFVNYMGDTATFEIRIKEDPENLVLTAEEKTALDQYNLTALETAKTILAQVLENPDSFSALAKEKSEDPGSKDNGGAYTGVTKGQFVAEYDNVIFGDLAVGAIYPEIVETSFGFHIIKKDGETGEGDGRSIDTSHILIMKESAEEVLASKQWKETDLVGMYIQTAEAFQPEEGVYAVGLSLDATGTEILKNFTEVNMNKQMAIFIDGIGIATPMIDRIIENGKIIITGNFTETGATNLATRLNSGVLNMPIRVAK